MEDTNYKPNISLTVTLIRLTITSESLKLSYSPSSFYHEVRRKGNLAILITNQTFLKLLL